MRHKFKKSRFRISFQTKNKIWIYKNSRLRNFYKIRSRVVLDSSKNAKKFLITKNMKWTVARRQMVPYFRSKTRFYFIYKNLFFTKQQLKTFHGGLKEYQLRNIFKNTWNVEQTFRTNVFLGALEQRLGMIMFRMRLLPTIFACNQLIKHHGIFVNNALITYPGFRVNLGHVVSIPSTYWKIFYDFIYERIRHRLWAHGLYLWRKNFFMKKLLLYRLRKKNFFISNFRLLDKYTLQKKRFFFYKKTLKYLAKNSAEIQTSSTFSKIFKMLMIILTRKIQPIMLVYEKKVREIHFWSAPQYKKTIRFLVPTLYGIKLLLTHFGFLVSRLILNIKLGELLKNYKKTNSVQEKTKISYFMQNLIKIALKKHLIWNITQKFFKFRVFPFLERDIKKTRTYRNQYMKYNRFIMFILRKLKYRKMKKKTFKNFCRQHHWYVPQYLEVDYKTLRASFVYYPEVKEVFFGFLCSFKKIVSFYKERAL